jgi:hypothetical protein
MMWLYQDRTKALCNCCFGAYFEREADSPKLFENIENREQRMESLECPNALAKKKHCIEVMGRQELSKVPSAVRAPAWLAGALLCLNACWCKSSWCCECLLRLRDSCFVDARFLQPDPPPRRKPRLTRIAAALPRPIPPTPPRQTGIRPRAEPRGHPRQVRL